VFVASLILSAFSTGFLLDFEEGGDIEKKLAADENRSSEERCTGRQALQVVVSNYSRFIRKVKAAGALEGLIDLSTGRQRKNCDANNYSRFNGKVKAAGVGHSAGKLSTDRHG